MKESKRVIESRKSTKELWFKYGTKVGFEAVSGTAASPLAATLQAFMACRATRNHNLLDSFEYLVTKQSGVRPLFKGLGPYAIRQTATSGYGFPVTDYLSTHSLSKIPPLFHPAVAGLIAGLGEAAVTCKIEQKELQLMLQRRHLPELRTVFTGAAARNPAAWISGEYARRYCEKRKLSPVASFYTGIGFGAAAGIFSMPMQNALFKSVHYNTDFFPTLRSMLQHSIRESFGGSMSRAMQVAIFNGFAMCFESLRQQWEQKQIKSRSIGF